MTEDSVKNNNTSKNKIEGSPLVLGVSVFGHDSSCALIDALSGEILVALTEERFSNVKHDGAFPAAALRMLTEEISVKNLGEIKYVALNINPTIFLDTLNFEIRNVLSGDLGAIFIHELHLMIQDADVLHSEYYPLNYLSAFLGRNFVDGETIDYLSGKISWYGNLAIGYRKLIKHLNQMFPAAEITSVDHHLAHAASAFYCSEFEQAAVLTIDGQGEAATTTLNFADGSEIRRLSQTVWPNSLGAVYMQIAWYLGFDGDSRYPGFGDEYKVMGMAAYGAPVYLHVFQEMGNVDEAGVLLLNFEKYLKLVPVQGCPGHSQPILSDEFINLLGERRSKDRPIEQKHFDIACSMQKFLEEIGLSMAKHLKNSCPDTDAICIAGGVGLNGLMNMEIYRNAGFKRIFVQPASGDDGTSLGAALYHYHHVLKGKRCPPLPNAFLGIDYGDDVIQLELEKYNLEFHKSECLHSELAHLLNDGNIIARYVGRGEFGPRALGHRSILANPAIASMKDSVNAKIKHRESFRPFAPACLKESVTEYFDVDIETPYMLLICQARIGARDKIPAVVHDDGTARVQTVSKDTNADLHGIISEFFKYSKIPVLLNTSFNVNGESIVETPADAIESFLFMGIDYLAIGSYIVSKTENVGRYVSQSQDSLIRRRQDRYKDKYFCPEMFMGSIGKTIASDVLRLSSQLNTFEEISAERLKAILILDGEVQRLRRELSTDTLRLFTEKIKSWVQ